MEFLKQQQADFSAFGGTWSGKSSQMEKQWLGKTIWIQSLDDVVQFIYPTLVVGGQRFDSKSAQEYSEKKKLSRGNVIITDKSN